MSFAIWSVCFPAFLADVFVWARVAFVRWFQQNIPLAFKPDLSSHDGQSPMCIVIAQRMWDWYRDFDGTIARREGDAYTIFSVLRWAIALSHQTTSPNAVLNH